MTDDIFEAGSSDEGIQAHRPQGRSPAQHAHDIAAKPMSIPVAGAPGELEGKASAAQTPLPRLTTFFGKEVIAPARITWAAVWLLLTACAFLGIGFISQDFRPFVFLVPFPAAMALALWVSRSGTVRFLFTEEGVQAAGLTLRYSEILGLYVPDDAPKRGNFAVHLLHDAGHLLIPESITPSSLELFDFLDSQPLGQKILPPVHSVFQNFLRQQMLLYGEKKIHVYSAASSLPGYRYLRFWTCFVIALLVTGISWTVLPSLVLGDRQSEWAVVGIVVTIVAIFFLAICAVARWSPRRPVKNWQRSCLIVTPSGLALIQGDLQGELRWEEVRDLIQRKGTVILKVEGAQIVLHDVFRWPLGYIFQRMQKYYLAARR